MRKSLLVVGITTIIGVATVVTLTNTSDNKVTETNKATETTSDIETSTEDIDLAVVDEIVEATTEETIEATIKTVEATTKVTETTEAIVETATVQETTIVQETTTTIQETTTEVPTTTEPTTEVPTESQTTTKKEVTTEEATTVTEEETTVKAEPVFKSLNKTMYAVDKFHPFKELSDNSSVYSMYVATYEYIEVTGVYEELGFYETTVGYVPMNLLADTFKKNEEFQSIPQGFFEVVNVGATEEDFNLVVDYLYSEVPYQIYKSLNGFSFSSITKDKVTIEIHGDYIYRNGVASDIKGTSNNHGVVSLTTTMENYDSYFKFALIHELAHMVDYNSNLAHREYLENSGIYEAEKSNYREPVCSGIAYNYHSSSTVGEYFAASVTSYIFEPQGLKGNCPQTYEYLQSVFDLYE